LVENRDSTCTYVAYLSYGFLLESDPKMESEARQQAMASMQATALDNGILDTAQKNAETEVRRLLFLVGYKSVEFAP
jgi:hypothetical protein